jgi:hypothetical protein
MQCQRLAHQAQRYPAMVCNNVCHVIDQAFLLAASHQLHKSSAPGMDHVTTQQYAAPLDANLRELHARRRDQRYVAPHGASPVW